MTHPQYPPQSYRGLELVTAIIRDALTQLKAAIGSSPVAEPLVLVDLLTVQGMRVGSGPGPNSVDNTLLGVDAGLSITTADDITAIGSESLVSVSSGNDNTGIGCSAGS